MMDQLKVKYPGVRTKVDKNGSTIIYANSWTLIKDIFKFLTTWKKKK